MIPWMLGNENLAANQLPMALIAAGILFFFGVLLILLWSDSPHSQLGQERTKDGFYLIGFAAIAAIFGLYVLLPVFALCAAAILWTVISAFKRTFLN